MVTIKNSKNGVVHLGHDSIIKHVKTTLPYNRNKYDILANHVFSNDIKQPFVVMISDQTTLHSLKYGWPDIASLSFIINNRCNNIASGTRLGPANVVLINDDDDFIMSLLEIKSSDIPYVLNGSTTVLTSCEVPVGYIFLLFDNIDPQKNFFILDEDHIMLLGGSEDYYGSFDLSIDVIKIMNNI